MYKKILVPTDGSALSSEAVHAGIEFARQLGADVVGIHVAPEYQYPIYAEAIPPDYPSEEGHNAEMRRIGEIYLGEIEMAAAGAGLKFSGKTVISDLTAQQIVAMADEQHCDLIFMASHGRNGWQRFLLGSVTSKVLAISQIPVLVYRSKRDATPT